MADSIYDQVLDIAAPQIKTLADSIEAYLTQEIDLEPREFNWQDIDSHSRGVTLRYVGDGIVPASDMGQTNSENGVGFPLYVVLVTAPESERDDESRAFNMLKQKIRQYYDHRRRMETLSSPGVLTLPSTVRDGGPTPPADLQLEHKIQMQTIYFWFLEPQTA